MKILHIYKDYPPVKGGVENIIKWVAESQAQAGHTVTVLVASPDRRKILKSNNGVVLHKMPRLTTIASTPITPTLPVDIRHYSPDIAHVHSPYPPGELFNMLLGRAQCSVMTYHSDVIRQKKVFVCYKPLFKLVLRHVDLIMPTSSNYLESSPLLHRYQKKCRVIPLGIDVSRFRTPLLPLATSLKNQFGSPLLLFVGRLRYYKGVDTLIEAMLHVPKAAHLMIVGDGALRATLEAQVKSLNLTKRIHFVGEVDDIDLPAFYQAADCFILPSNSRAEAFGIVLLEAMASGLPCISTKLGTATSWIVQDGKTGFVVPPKNPHGMAEAMNTLLEDKSLRQSFGHAALKRVQSEFSLEKMSSHIMQTYEELCGDLG